VQLTTAARAFYEKYEKIFEPLKTQGNCIDCNEGTPFSWLEIQDPVAENAESRQESQRGFLSNVLIRNRPHRLFFHKMHPGYAKLSVVQWNLQA
jgi:hypothetical protein